MPLYTEHWSARPVWLALSIDERIRLLDPLGPVIDRLLASGAMLIGVAFCESRLRHRDDAQYLAPWRMPAGEPQRRTLETALAAAGWGRYVEPVAASPLSVLEASNSPRSSTREPRDRASANGHRDGPPRRDRQSHPSSRYQSMVAATPLSSGMLGV